MRYDPLYVSLGLKGLIKTGFVLTHLGKISHTQFREILYGCSRIVACGRKDRHSDANFTLFYAVYYDTITIIKRK